MYQLNHYHYYLIKNYVINMVSNLSIKKTVLSSFFPQIFCFVLILTLKKVVGKEITEGNIQDRKLMKGDGLDIQIRAVHINELSQGEQFNIKEKFALQIGQLSHNHPHYSFMKIFNYDKILVPNSPFDYQNISKRINFTLLADQLFHSLPYYQFSFKYKPQLQTNPQNIEIEHIQGQWDSPDVRKRIKDSLGVQPNHPNFPFLLARDIVLQGTQIVKEIEYRYFDKQYQIGKIDKQMPICVYSGGHKVWSKNRFLTFFQTIEKVNYTNFHIVYLDDNSPKNEILNIVAFLQNRQSRIKNRIKIIQTLSHSDATANIAFFIKQYCNPDDVVAIIDPDDGVLGTQVFKVLNSVYSDKEVWGTYSKLITKDSEDGPYRPGFSKKISVPINEYRYKVLFEASALRAFRYKLFVKLPYESIIEYRVVQGQSLNKEGGKKAFPFFPTYASDMPEYLNLFQMSGQKHTRFINEYLYWYIGSTKSQVSSDCTRDYELLDDIKFRVRNQIKTLANLEDQVVFLDTRQEKLQYFKKELENYYYHQKCSIFKRHHILIYLVLAIIPLLFIFLLKIKRLKKKIMFQKLGSDQQEKKQLDK